MTNFKIFLFIFLHFIVTYAKISDLRRCANPDCSEPVSLAKTVTTYYSDDSRILSFPPNVDVKIFSKEAGTKLNLWGAEISGRRGYVPKSHVRETKILKEKLDFLIPTEGQDDPTLKSVPTISTEKPVENEKSTLQDQISPQAVTPPYEVIDGTTLYLGPGANSSPEYSSTPSSIDSSVVEQSVEESTTETNSLDEKSLTPASETKEDINAKPDDDNKENHNSIDQKPVDILTPTSEAKEEVKENINAKPGDDNKENHNNITETNSVDQKPVDILTPTSKAEEEVKENIIAKEDVEDEENEDDEDTEDEDDTEENEEDYNDDENEEDVESSTEAQQSPEVPVVSEKASLETVENVTEVISSQEIKDGPVNNSASPEPVVEKTDHPDLNPVIQDPLEVQPVAVESKANDHQPVSVKLKADNPIVIELETDEFTPVFVDLKSDEVTELKENKIELNSLPNPLDFFHQPLNEMKDELDVSQNQVPENNENEPSPSLIAENIPTTQASIDDVILPNIETFTENPGNINNPTEKSSIEEDKSEEIKSVEQLISDIKQIDPETNLSNLELIEDEIEIDQSEKPVFIDTVGEKFNPLELEDIPQPNNLDQNIENVSDSYEENTETNINEQETEQMSAEESSELVDGKQESIFSKIYSSIFGSSDNQDVPVEEMINDIHNNDLIDESTEEAKIIDRYKAVWGDHLNEKPVDKYLPIDDNPEFSNNPSDMQSCATSDNPALCGIHQNNINNENMISSEEVTWSFEVPENAYNIFLYLSLTAVTVLLFSLGFYYIEKKRKDGSLIECINNLEKKLLISSKECLLLQDELKSTKERLISIEDSSFGSNEMVTSLKEELEEARGTRIELEEQVTNLEKELENATEAGMELNRMLREILTSQSGNVHLMQNVEHLQKQLNEQQETINSMKAILIVKNTENELLQTELSVANEKNNQLQEELDKMVVNLLSVQEEKNNIENKLEDQNEKLKSEYETNIKQINTELNVLKQDNKKLKKKIEETQRIIDLKNNEYDNLKQGMNEMFAAQSNKDSIMALLDVSQVKAEVQQLRDEKHKIAEKLQKEIEEKSVFEKEVQVMIQEVKILKDKFDEAEKEKVEAQTRLEVLSTYFKDKEAQLQKEINEHESKFMQKEGEATSTIERIKWIQEELQNYKSQNELLKKEILDQEVSLKSQISMLEKKSHDNWVLARQAERRLEESKQEASQLRNRLTIVEKNLNNSSQMGDESKLTNRIMSPLESNGELPVSPLHMSQVEAPGSPPLLFPHRDFMTTSPPLSRLPPFMPPPPSGVVPPLMPLPMPGGVPPFMLPPPALFPGDHRLPPIGRMSSPPLHRHYSHDYSSYDRDDSPPLSPSYEDSDCRRRSPSPSPNYNPYGNKQFRQWERDEDRDRDYRGAQQRNKSRMHKGLSSGSGNSNESLDNSGRHSGRV